MKGLAFVLLAALALAAGCARPALSGQSARPGLVSAADLPRGLVRCSESGDMATYLDQLQVSSPGAYEASAHGWLAAKEAGARSASVELFADRRTNCRLLHDIGAEVTGRPRLAFSLVYRFGSRGAAAAAYRASSIGQGGVLEGTRSGSSTGLGENSTTIAQENGDRTYFLAFWQRGAYAIDFFAINLEPGQALRIAQRIDARSR